MTQHPERDDSAKMQDVFTKARAAQALWSRQSFTERAQHLRHMRDYIVAHADALAKIISEDTLKTRMDALADEILPCASACDWYGKNAADVLAPRSLKSSIPVLFHKKSEVIHIPLGVVGIISPWNYPLTIPFGEIIMGLMAGNAIIAKTSEVTPKVGAALDDILAAGKLPEGLFQRVEGPGAAIVGAWLACGINKIFFTGSTRVGKDILRRAADTLTPVSLELGGNDPMIVLADADLERASNGAIWGAYQNGGQTCASVERCYVHASRYEEFMQLLRIKTKSLRHGQDKGHFDVDVGGITTQAQWDIIDLHVKEAMRDGAKIEAQSTLATDSVGRFYPATLISNVNHQMTIMREETFGPVLCVMPFQTIEEAIALANDSHYALTSSIWTSDNTLGRQLAERIEAGVTAINDHSVTHAFSETPWGGWKQSGLGRTHGAEGLREMTHVKTVNWDVLPAKRNIYWYPANRESYQAVLQAIDVCFGSLGQKVKSGGKILPFATRKMFFD
jgi:acyl-CoA reductase-like NAD-dependent aldehyde dehydrogenase